MESMPRKRSKSETKTPRRNPNPSSAPIGASMEPPKTLFPPKEEFARLVAVVAIASAVAFACSFLAGFLSSNPKPFCDYSFDSIDLDSDLCETCPENGECYQGKLECKHGYRKQGKLCVEDGELNESTKKLMKKIERKVCEANAHNECYGTGVIWVQENDIWEDLRGNSVMENLDEHGYLYLKGKVVEAIDKLLEKRTDSLGTRELKCPESLVEYYKPLTCRVRQWLSRQILVIVPACALLLGCTLLHQKFRRKRYISHRVEELYHQVCDILEENALTAKSSESDSEPWVITSRLRDHLLWPRERKDPLLWRKVEELIQEDSRIDRYPKIVKGESKVVWEWQVEGSLSLSKLKKRQERHKFRQSDNSGSILQANYNRKITEASS
ncbi:PREDICTED: uncharacterized protein LOC104827742 [Tarenaya hassleriana]|uniref:uncharacterized protein LOC104827742 n=1 Tax=Tarenaya hassleriana TaxID=28532 RepID=UPI00053C3871|nr:PREDICTED: uncharacterized protein LOC104827742 [Tarenaya hassleriana]